MQLNNGCLALAASFALAGAGLVTSTPLAAAAYSSPFINSPTSIVQSCNGISERYVTQGTLKDIIKQQFCPHAVNLKPNTHMIEWLYNEDTPEYVAISVNWTNKSDKSNFELNPHDCDRYLRKMVLDGCDGNDPNNPMNWKGGGQLQVDGVTYAIEPLVQRQPAPKEPHGVCNVAHNDNYHHVVIQGNGWANSDWGRMLEDKLCDCDLLPDTFHFTYRPGKDGSEWKATMYTTTWREGCIVDAAKEVGAPNDFKCDASG
ncbi:hypothetical protein ACJ73_10212 [Blastomyces percursus]|uniref:Ecp2 effector protein domain-containing protein n=1 Tax=Blastomyces percursus TaxID=1658174 RepID=A0A1J9NZN6_9EURO|nr:hypothetical protein ACJ73_10212 [Blastomyces percursus]